MLTLPSAAPAPKKRKTGATTSSKVQPSKDETDEAVPVVEDEEDADGDDAEGDEEEEEDAEVEDGDGDEEADDTAAKGGPAAAAKAATKGTVPKEKSLDEVEAAE